MLARSEALLQKASPSTFLGERRLPINEATQGETAAHRRRMRRIHPS